MHTRRAVIITAALAAAACAAAAHAQSRVLILSSGVPALDETVRDTLNAEGLVATVGPQFTAFTSGVSLASTDVVYFQANFNWSSGDMPLDGQQSLLDFVTAGGGLVTCEWAAFLARPTSLTVIGPAFPVTEFGNTAAPVVTYSVVTPHLVMTAGLPAQFEMTLTSYAGTEGQLDPKPGATVFLGASTYPSGGGVVGSTWGAGRVVSFSTTNGPDQFNSAPFRRLLANSMRWADALPSTCYPDCNGDGQINLSDFGCFQTKFALGDPYADCNGDGVRNLSDFGCFQTKFALGCP